MWVDKLKHKKDRMLLPLSRAFARKGIKPMHITWLGVVFGFFALFFMLRNHFFFVVFSILWIIMDGIDGSLARYTKKEVFWHDYASDRVIFLLLMSKTITILGQDIVLWAIAAYFFTHTINLARKQNYLLVYPEIPAMILYFFGYYNFAALFVIALSIANIAIIFLLSRIRGLSKIFLKTTSS